jgi:hypothetical protein
LNSCITRNRFEQGTAARSVAALTLLQEHGLRFEEAQATKATRAGQLLLDALKGRRHQKSRSDVKQTNKHNNASSHDEHTTITLTLPEPQQLSTRENTNRNTDTSTFMHLPLHCVCEGLCRLH